MSKQLAMNQKYVYVLLTRTNTIVAKLIRLYTREPFSHASIALDMQLDELYSFARKQRFNPLNSGFIKENIDKGVFGADKKVYCGVYEIPVTEEQYEHICREIQHFRNNMDDYGYNYLGLFCAMIGKDIEDGIHFMCSQFVYHVFLKCGVKLFARRKGPIRPFHFHTNLKDRQIYTGNLHQYREHIQNQLPPLAVEADGYAEAI